MSVSRANGEGELSQFKKRVETLHDRVTELAGDEDLLDTLYFGWSDRPYARATLAILVKVVATLDREVDCRGHGNGKIDDVTVETMLEWADKAVQRVMRAQPTDDFRPHRMKTTWAALLDGTNVPSLYAFVDGTRLYPRHPVFGDLDLLAALGQRVFARPPGERSPAEELEVTARRAEALGEEVLDWTILFLGPKGFIPCGRGHEDVQTGWPEHRQYVAVGVIAMLVAGGEPMTWEDPALPAVRERIGGESIPASLARRAMLRGAINRSTYAVTSWTPPITSAPTDQRLAALRAAMWVQELDGQRLALIDTWRDTQSEDSGTRPSVFLDPAEAETIAHTALDLQRLAKFARGFESRPSIAIVVGSEAIGDPQINDSETQLDTWAPWMQPFWDALVTRQVRFDVVSDRTEESTLRERYRVAVRLRPEDAVNPANAIGKLERRLAQDIEHVYRLTAREMDGTIAPDVYLRAGQTPERKACAAVVNLSDRPRVLKLRGRPAIGESRDVITNQQISEPNQRLEFAPWQVRLLWPRE